MYVNYTTIEWLYNGMSVVPEIIMMLVSNFI